MCKSPGPVSEEKMDTAIDLFEREDAAHDKELLTEGATNNRLYIVRGGAVEATCNGQPATLREAGGFTFFGDDSMMVSSLSRACLCWAAETWSNLCSRNACTDAAKLHFVCTPLLPTLLSALPLAAANLVALSLCLLPTQR